MLFRRFMSTAVTLTLFATTSYATSVSHSLGVTELEQVPTNIIALDLAAVDTLSVLGVDIVGVPKPHISNYLEPFNSDTYISVGSFWEPDFETIASIQPDLIITGGRTQQQYDEMSKISPTIDSTVWGEHFLDQFYTTTRMLATATNTVDQANEKLDDIEQRISVIRNSEKNNKNALFILVTGGKILAYGPGSRFGWIHDDLGIEPAAEKFESQIHGDPISFEFLTEADPDIIFVLDRDVTVGDSSNSAKTVLDNELVHQLSAYKNDRIVYVDGYSWYLVAYGLTAVSNTLTDIEMTLGIQ